MLALPMTLAACGNDKPGGGATNLPGAIYFVGNIGIGSEIWKLDLVTGDDKKVGIGSMPTRTKEGTFVLVDVDLFEAPSDLTSRRVIARSDGGPDFAFHGFFNPQVSPDGTRIAYSTNDHEVFVAARATGAIVARFDKLTDPTAGLYRPTWTPDGRIVVAGGFANQGLFVSDAGLTTLTRFDPNLVQPSDPAVSPDGTKVAFVLKTKVFVIGLDGTGLTPLTDEDEAGDGLPTWSPDGAFIAYASGSRLHVKPAGGGAAQDFFDLYPQFQANHLVFAPSGQFSWS
ncbi:MAG: hypothetical protein NVS3B10_31580 [Polyangiales bacterium]